MLVQRPSGALQHMTMGCKLFEKLSVIITSLRLQTPALSVHLDQRDSRGSSFHRLYWWCCYSCFVPERIYFSASVGMASKSSAAYLERTTRMPPGMAKS